MDIFGAQWINHPEKIAQSWRETITDEDLVLIAGDISWAMYLEEAKSDLEWIGSLPGTKVMIRGNHDYWWHSLAKVKTILPPKCHAIQNDHYNWHGVSIGGTRLWDSHEFHFNTYIDYQERERDTPTHQLENEKILARELHRLELSLNSLDPKASLRIAMTHYPPIGPHLSPSQASLLFEKYGVNIVVFGHLHNVKKEIPIFGTKNNIQYLLTSADYLNFTPIKVATIS